MFSCKFHIIYSLELIEQMEASTEFAEQSKKYILVKAEVSLI